MSMCVLQDWVCSLTLMQQGVIIAAIRGPDGIKKDHVAKVLLRWYRRCVLNAAFESAALGEEYVFPTPAIPGGGSFTGPITKAYLIASKITHGEEDGSGWRALDLAVDDYFRSLDEIPHHYQLHFMHAAEVLGYRHTDSLRRAWWNRLYLRLANDMHLNPETEEQMNLRLGDSENQWRAAEEVTAR